MSEHQAAHASSKPGSSRVGPAPAQALTDAYRSWPRDRQRRLQVISGGGMAGLGLGIALAWTLGIFQRAHPQAAFTTPSGSVTNAFPPMVVTVIVVVIIAGLAVGLGIGLLVAAFIPRDGS